MYPWPGRKTPDGRRWARIRKGLYTPSEIGRAWGVPHRTVLRWCRTGVLEARRVTLNDRWRWACTFAALLRALRPETSRLKESMRLAIVARQRERDEQDKKVSGEELDKKKVSGEEQDKQKVTSPHDDPLSDPLLPPSLE